MDDWINTLGQGLLFGSMYALFATGLSLSFGIMRLINIAHGDLIVLAAFAAIALAEPLAIGPFAVLPLVVLLMAGFGYLLQRLVLNGTLDGDPLRPLLVALPSSHPIAALAAKASPTILPMTLDKARVSTSTPYGNPGLRIIGCMTTSCRNCRR